MLLMPQSQTLWAGRMSLMTCLCWRWKHRTSMNEFHMHSDVCFLVADTTLLSTASLYASPTETSHAKLHMRPWLATSLWQQHTAMSCLGMASRSA